jgi:hypothetical protein
VKFQVAEALQLVEAAISEKNAVSEKEKIACGDYCLIISIR